MYQRLLATRLVIVSLIEISITIEIDHLPYTFERY